jgi:Bacterial RNA polymerase, alpha chain C terminal domain
VLKVARTISFIKNTTMESASKLREMVTKFNVEECKQLRRWLKDRIRLLKNRSFTEMPIDELPLSDKARFILKHENMKTVRDILIRGIGGIYIIRGVGSVTLKEIRECIEGHLPEAFSNPEPQIPSDIEWR